MSDETLWLLALLLGFQVKHLAADFLLQTPFMLKGKGRYGHSGGLAHAGLHGLFSGVVLLVAGVPPGLTAIVSLAEAVLHYHIDWGKEQLSARLALVQTQRSFWMLFGFDQWLHQVTYLVMAAAVVSGRG